MVQRGREVLRGSVVGSAFSYFPFKVQQCFLFAFSLCFLSVGFLSVFSLSVFSFCEKSGGAAW